MLGPTSWAYISIILAVSSYLTLTSFGVIEGIGQRISRNPFLSKLICYKLIIKFYIIYVIIFLIAVISCFNKIGLEGIFSVPIMLGILMINTARFYLRGKGLYDYLNKINIVLFIGNLLTLIFVYIFCELLTFLISISLINPSASLIFCIYIRKKILNQKFTKFKISFKKLKKFSQIGINLLITSFLIEFYLSFDRFYYLMYDELLVGKIAYSSICIKGILLLSSIFNNFFFKRTFENTFIRNKLETNKIIFTQIIITIISSTVLIFTFYSFFNSQYFNELNSEYYGISNIFISQCTVAIPIIIISPITVVINFALGTLPILLIHSAQVIIVTVIILLYDIFYGIIPYQLFYIVITLSYIVVLFICIKNYNKIYDRN